MWGTNDFGKQLDTWKQAPVDNSVRLGSIGASGLETSDTQRAAFNLFRELVGARNSSLLNWLMNPTTENRVMNKFQARQAMEPTLRLSDFLGTFDAPRFREFEVPDYAGRSNQSFRSRLVAQ